MSGFEFQEMRYRICETCFRIAKFGEALQAENDPGEARELLSALFRTSLSLVKIFPPDLVDENDFRRIFPQFFGESGPTNREWMRSGLLSRSTQAVPTSNSTSNSPSNPSTQPRGSPNQNQRTSINFLLDGPTAENHDLECRKHSLSPHPEVVKAAMSAQRSQRSPSESPDRPISESRTKAYAVESFGRSDSPKRTPPKHSPERALHKSPARTWDIVPYVLADGTFGPLRPKYSSLQFVEERPGEPDHKASGSRKMIHKPLPLDRRKKVGESQKKRARHAIES